MARKYANFYIARLSSDISASDVEIPITALPRDDDGQVIEEGKLVIDAKRPDKREVIGFTGTDGSKLIGVTRALGGTLATTHQRNSTIEMTVLGSDLSEMYDAAEIVKDLPQMMGLIYPIGSLYFNATDNTNPATLLGFGTWAAFGAGRVPVGFDSGQTEFNSAGKTGGAKTHTLTIAQMPSHTHGMRHLGSTSGGTLGWSGGSGTTSNTGTLSTGGGGAHNNLQPYITVYIWRRTS